MVVRLEIKIFSLTLMWLIITFGVGGCKIIFDMLYRGAEAGLGFLIK